MATIWTSIRMHDGLTPAFKNVNKALNSVNSAFQKLQNLSSKGVNAKSINSITRDLTVAQNNLNKTQSTLERVRQKTLQNRNAQQQHNRSLQAGATAASGLWNKIKGIFSLYMGIQATGGIIKIADELTMTTARLNLMTGSLEETKKVQDQIYQSAMRSRSGYLQTADAVAKLRLRAGQIFKSNNEAIAFTETLNKMYAIAGASQSEMYSSTLQLTQALGSGVLRGEEFRAVFEAAPNVMQAVADYMNLPIGKLREIANEGAITADIVKNAMFKAAEQVDKQFASIPMTWAQVWTTVKNYTLKIFDPILVKIREIANSERFVKFANAVGNAMAFVAKVLVTVFDLMVKIGAWMYDNWATIEPILQAIAITYLGLMIAKLAVMTYHLVAQTVMWAIMNWKILAVIAVIYVLIKIAMELGYTFNEILGGVCAAFTMLGATAYNVFALMYNTTASVVEFFYNVWSNSIYSVKSLLVNLCTAFLDMCISMTQGWDGFATNFANAIIDAINVVLKGWNWLVDKLGVVGEKIGLGKATMIEKRTSITSDLSNAKAGLQNWLGDKPEGYKSIQRMEYKNVGELTKKAYNWGSNLADNLSKTVGAIEDSISNAMNLGNGIGNADGLNDLGKALNKGFGNDNPALKDILENTDKIADNTSVDTTDEDLSYMRDLAEREAINKYTMSDVKIEMTNNNNVNSKFDLDDMVSYLQKKIYEGVVSTASGVHF